MHISLWQERLYRRLYNWVIKKRIHTDRYLFDMNPYRFKDEEGPILKVMFSTTLILFYSLVSSLPNLHLKPYNWILQLEVKYHLGMYLSKVSNNSVIP